jgi:hypothetical protein
MTPTSQTTSRNVEPVFNPAALALTYDVPDHNGDVRYNILANGTCIEEGTCKPWELEDRLGMLVENMYKVC